MSELDHESDDDRLAELLVDIETQLAVGADCTTRPEARLPGASQTQLERLRKAEECLALLEEIWPHAKPFDDEPPHAIGRFRIMHELGRGGFGIVYLAYDERLDRQIALKVQRPEATVSAVLRQRFLREARAAARLVHPQIARVHEVGEDGLQIWIAREYVAGDSLSEWLRADRPPVAPKTAASLVASLAEALEFAHRNGVLHRDLKPGNVLLESLQPDEPLPTDLEACQPKLIDFGLARLDEGLRHDTRSGALIGTPPYMAPEQATGEVNKIGPTTDVYGLGAILYELLTGQQVFRGDCDVAILRRVLEDEPPNPRSLRRDVPADLAAITLKCLEKKPANRYQTAAAVALDLKRFCAGEPTVARPLTPVERVEKWSRRRPALAALVAVSVLAASVIAASNVLYIRQLRQSNQTAEGLRVEAETNAAMARQQQELANHYLYASRMRLAYELLAQGDADRAGQLVEPYEPPAPLANRRGFEWYHLKRRLHPERLNLNAHQGQAYGVAFSPDAQTVASGGQDGLIRLWDAQSGRCPATLAGHTSCVNDVAFSPDGQLLASVSCDSKVKFWQAASHELLATLDQHPDEVRCLAFSHDGARLATGGKGPLVVIWDVASRQPVKTFAVNTENVDFLAWRDDDTLILQSEASYVQGDQTVLVLWNVETDTRIQSCSVPRRIRSLVASPDGRDVIIGTSYGTIHSVPELSAHPINVAGPKCGIWSLSFTPSGEWLAAGYDDGSIRVFSASDMICRQVLPGHGARPQTVAFAPSGEGLASAHWDGTVKLWSLGFESTPKLVSACVGDHRTTCAYLVAISPDFKYVALPSAADRVAVFGLVSGELLAEIAVSDPVRALSFDRTDPELLYGYAPDSGSVWKWRWRDGHQATIDSLSPARFGPYAISPEAQVFSCLGPPRSRLVIRSAADQTEWWARGYQAPSGGLIASPDRLVLAIKDSFYQGGTLTSKADIVDLSRRQALFESRDTVIAVSNGGRLIAVEDSPHALGLIDTSTQQKFCRIRSEEPISGAAFSPEDRTLATGDTTGRVLLWNVATGNLITRFETGESSIADLRFSADGRNLVAITQSDIQADEHEKWSTCRLFVWSGTEGP